MKLSQVLSIALFGTALLGCQPAQKPEQPVVPKAFCDMEADQVGPAVFAWLEKCTTSADVAKLWADVDKCSSHITSSQQTRIESRWQDLTFRDAGRAKNFDEMVKVWNDSMVLDDPLRLVLYQRVIGFLQKPEQIKQIGLAGYEYYNDGFDEILNPRWDALSLDALAHASTSKDLQGVWDSAREGSTAKLRVSDKAAGIAIMGLGQVHTVDVLQIYWKGLEKVQANNPYVMGFYANRGYEILTACGNECSTDSFSWVLGITQSNDEHYNKLARLYDAAVAREMPTATKDHAERVWREARTNQSRSVALARLGQLYFGS